jgi:hypothetical protein
VPRVASSAIRNLGRPDSWAVAELHTQQPGRESGTR